MKDADMTEELLKRLEAVAQNEGEHWGSFKEPAVDVPVSYLTEAAALIRQLKAEVEELRAAKWKQKYVDTMNDMALTGLARDSEAERADRAEALSRSMREALEPFAIYAQRLRPDDPDNDRPAFARAAEYRRAAQSLNQTDDARNIG